MPPVRKTVTVKQPVDEAFAIFTGRIASWWPRASQAPGLGVGKAPGAMVLEPRAGGRIYERSSDGTIVYWGEVTAFEPPRALLLAWQPHQDPRAATEVEIRFTPEGSSTRIELEHRDWERLGESAAAARAEYDAGWEDVLRLYGAAGRENGHAIAAIVLGVVSVFVPVLGILAAPFGIAFGILGRRRAREGAPRGGLATAGLTLAASASSCGEYCSSAGSAS